MALGTMAPAAARFPSASPLERLIVHGLGTKRLFGAAKIKDETVGPVMVVVHAETRRTTGQLVSHAMVCVHKGWVASQKVVPEVPEAELRPKIPERDGPPEVHALIRRAIDRYLSGERYELPSEADFGPSL